MLLAFLVGDLSHTLRAYVCDQALLLVVSRLFLLPSPCLVLHLCACIIWRFTSGPGALSLDLGVVLVKPLTLLVLVLSTVATLEY